MSELIEELANYRILVPKLDKAVAEKDAEIANLNEWVHDLQSGMYVNCVYCGHRYGPADKMAPTMQQVLYAHIAKCPKHPLSQANAKIAALRQTLKNIIDGSVGLGGMPAGSTYQELLIILTHVVEHARAGLAANTGEMK